MSIFFQNQADFLFFAMPIATVESPATPTAKTVLERIEELQSRARKLIEENLNEKDDAKKTEVLELLNQAAEALKSPEDQDELQPMTIPEQIKEYKKLASLFIQANEENEALELLNQAVQTLNSSLNRKALQSMTIPERTNEYKDLADLFIQANGQIDALELLRQAADLLNSYECLNSLKNMAPTERANYYEKFVEQLIKVGGKAKAWEVLYRAEVLLDFDKNRTDGKKLSEETKTRLTKQLEELRKKTGETPKPPAIWAVTKYIEELRDQAQKLIRENPSKKNDALKLLEKAAEILKSAEGQEEVKGLNERIGQILVFIGMFRGFQAF